MPAYDGSLFPYPASEVNYGRRYQNYTDASFIELIAATTTPLFPFVAATGMMVRRAIAVTQKGAPPLLYIARSDVYQAVFLDLYTPGLTVNGIRYRTHPLLGSEGYTRQKRKRFRRIHVFGEGTLSGGTITLNFDPPSGRSFTAPIASAASLPVNDGVTDRLLVQDAPDSAWGFVLDVDLQLSGIGVVIRTVLCEYVEID